MLSKEVTTIWVTKVPRKIRSKTDNISAIRVDFYFNDSNRGTREYRFTNWKAAVTFLKDCVDSMVTTPPPYKWTLLTTSVEKRDRDEEKEGAGED